MLGLAYVSGYDQSTFTRPPTETCHIGLCHPMAHRHWVTPRYGPSQSRALSPAQSQETGGCTAGFSAKPCHRLCCEKCHCVINHHHQEKVQLARTHGYREEAPRGTQTLKWSRHFPHVHPHNLAMSHNADKDNVVPFTSRVRASFQDPVYHMPAHFTNFKVILACHFPHGVLEAASQVQWSCSYHSSLEVREITQSSTEEINFSLSLPSPAFSDLVTVHNVIIVR